VITIAHNHPESLPQTGDNQCLTTHPFRGSRVFSGIKTNSIIEMKFHKGDQELTLDTAKIAIRSTHSPLRLEKAHEKKTTYTNQAQ
jgi:hypothetical protein